MLSTLWYKHPNSRGEPGEPGRLPAGWQDVSWRRDSPYMSRIEAASIAVPASSLDETEEPPGSPRRHPKWSDVPDGQWDDWRWQMQNAIRTTSQLAEFYAFGPQEFAALEQLEQKY